MSETKCYRHGKGPDGVEVNIPSLLCIRNVGDRWFYVWKSGAVEFVGVADLAGRAFPFAIEKSLCNADGSQVREDGKTALITQKQAANLKPVVLWALWSEIKKLHDDPKP